MNEPDRQGWLRHPHPHVRTAVAQVRRHRVWLYVLAGLFVLFGLLGYFWLPGYAKGKLEEALSAKLHRPVTVERIEINPYTLEATVRGFRIGEASGSGALFKFDSLYVNLSSMSIARAAPVVSAVTLSGPVLHLARDAEGRLSIADLIEAFSQQPPSEGETHFSVSNIRVENGSFEFDDDLKHTKQRVSEINLGLPFLANFDSSEEVWVQPHLSARINDGSLIDLQGRARPFADKREAVLDVKLDGLDLTDLVAYAPLGGMQLHAGRFDAQLEIGFSKDEQQAAAIRIDGTLGLRDADLENRAGLPWRLRGQRLAVHLQRFDPMLKHPIDAALEATQLNFRQGDKPEMNIDSLRVDDVHADLAAHTARFALNAGINGKGKLDAKGSVGWAPLTADLTVKADQVDLVALQGFLIEHPFVVATKGALSFDGSVKAAGTPLNVAVKGDARVNDLYLLDKTNNDDLLRWRSLDVAGIDVNTAPLDVKIHSITGSDFFARVTIMPDGTLRLRDVIEPGSARPVDTAALKTAAQAAQQRAEQQAAARKAGASAADAAATAVPAPAPAAEVSAESDTDADADAAAAAAPAKVARAPVATEKAPLPVRIDEIVLKNGGLIFNDRFIKPNYRANLSGLNGRIGPLYPGQRGAVAVKGMVNRNAPLDIKGKLDPFGKSLYLDLSAKAKGIDMPGFSPYSSRYLGYVIDKGKLSVDLHYYIEQGELRAENHIFLDQFTLGEKIDSPNAISLPLGLAVSLLKNSRGEIDIDLPISGSLNDPQFSVGGLVLKVFVNLIVKAVTAPFALLGSIFGGGVDLSHVDFAPGYAALTPAAQKSLDAIAKAMSERPALKIEIAGVADAANDPPGLRHAQLERRVKAQKLADLAKQGKGGGSLSEVTVSAQEYPKYLELAYKAEKFDKPRNFIGLTKSLPVAEMEQLMLAHMPTDDDALRALAERRARAAQKALLDQGVPSERVFMVQPRIDAAAQGQPGGRVDFSLH